MPKTWLYGIALVLPLILRVLIIDTGMVEWLGHNGHTGLYGALGAVRANPLFLTFIGGWFYPVFAVTAIIWSFMDEEDNDVTHHFLLLPILYVPFTIVGDILLTAQVNLSNLFIHPLIILPIGYVYVFAWVIFIWVLGKLGLVM